MPRIQTAVTVSGGVMPPPYQLGHRTPLALVPPPDQVENWTVGSASGGKVLPKQVRNPTPVSAPPPPPKQVRNQTVSGGVVLPKQIGNRTPVSALASPKQVRNQSALSVQLPRKQRRDQTIGTVSDGEVLRKQVGNGTVLPLPKQHRDQTLGTLSIGKVLRKQVGNRTASSVPPPLKQLRDQMVGPVSGGEVPLKQVRNRTACSVLPLPKQRRDQTLSTVSFGGEVLPKQVGNQTVLPFLRGEVLPPPKLRRNQTVGPVSSGESLLHTTKQGSASSSKSSACAALRGNASLHDHKPSAAANKASVQVKAKKNKELDEAEDEIRRLNKLGLGDNVSYKEYCVYLKQLPDKPYVDISTKLDDMQLEELNARHVLYCIKYNQLSQHAPEDKLCYDKLEENYLPNRPEGERISKCYEEDGELDWSFHADYCKLAGLEDYQRLVPRNYGDLEYVNWNEYHKFCHSYEIEQEYVKYCEELSKKLKWIEAYVLNNPSSLMWGKIMTRGTYQAIKIATNFSKIYDGLAFSGFYEWLDSMCFDVCCHNEFDGLYYEIWQRYSMEKKFRDALYEVHELNMFPLRQERMRRALENDIFCSDLEEEFLACTACLKEFAEDKRQITEVKARELIAEALRKETQKPKFYDDYCRKMDIAQAIGLIPSVPS